jgi:hypothetical protein
MAEPDQPKKETVRIELPLPPAPESPEGAVKPRDTVRIQLPVRETENPPVNSSSASGTGSAVDDISSRNLAPSPKPASGPKSLSASLGPVPVSPPLGPKKETVRIPLMPEPLRSAQKKTQPLIAMPEIAPQNPPIAVSPAENSSMLLYWVLLGVSALILIIQIWTYFS